MIPPPINHQSSIICMDDHSPDDSQLPAEHNNPSRDAKNPYRASRTPPSTHSLPKPVPTVHTTTSDTKEPVEHNGTIFHVGDYAGTTFFSFQDALWDTWGIWCPKCGLLKWNCPTLIHCHFADPISPKLHPAFVLTAISGHSNKPRKLTKSFLPSSFLPKTG